MKKMNRILLPIFILLIITSSVSAQESAYEEPVKDHAGWSMALMSGFNQYYGDISQKGFFGKFDGETKSMWSIMIGKQMNDWFTLRGQIMGGTLQSYKDTFDDGDEANLMMNTRYFELGLNGRFELDRLWNSYGTERRWQVYGVAGLSFASWDAFLKDYVLNSEIDPGGDKVHSGLVIPLGVGLEYQVYENWYVFTEWTMRFVASEMVDLVQGNFSSDPILNVALGVNYKFGLPTNKKKNESEVAEETEAEDYERLAFEGPDIMDFSPENTCTSDQVNDHARDYGQNKNDGKDFGRFLDNKTQAQANFGTPAPVVMSASGNNIERAVLGEGIVYSVQVLAMSKPINANIWKHRYNLTKTVREYSADGLYRYIVGYFNSYNDAENYARVVRAKGVHDAFVVVFNNGRKVPLTAQMKNVY